MSPREIIRLYTSAQFVRFLAVGGAALLVHWCARFVLNIWTSYSLAIVLAYGVGMTTAYGLNRIFVFPDSTRLMRTEIAYFVTVNVAAFPFVWAAAEILGVHVFPRVLQPELAKSTAHAFAITLPVFANFAAHKFLTFKEAGDRA